MLRTAWSAQRAPVQSPWKICSGSASTECTMEIPHRLRRLHRAGNLVMLVALVAHCGAATSPWPISAGDASTLRQVVLVHRHGARFPTKLTGKADIAWPIRTQFWESYKGHLTPVGCSQLQDTISLTYVDICRQLTKYDRIRQKQFLKVKESEIRSQNVNCLRFFASFV